MNGSARLLIIERVIPPGNDPFFGKLVDITMLALTGGMERTHAEYGRLLKGAGLRLNRVIPTRTGSSVIEALQG
jgi:O-methyltransferase